MDDNLMRREGGRVRAGEKAALAPRPHIQMKTCALCSFAYLVNYVLFTNIRSKRVINGIVSEKIRRVLSAVSVTADASVNAITFISAGQAGGRQVGKESQIRRWSLYSQDILDFGSLQHPLWMRHVRTHTRQRALRRGPGSHRPHLPPSLPSSLPSLLSPSLPRLPASAGEAGMYPQGSGAGNFSPLRSLFFRDSRRGTPHPVGKTRTMAHRCTYTPRVSTASHPWPLSRRPPKKKKQARPFGQKDGQWKQPPFAASTCCETLQPQVHAECEGPKLEYGMLVLPLATSPSHS